MFVQGTMDVIEDKQKTKALLLQELDSLRERVSELKQAKEKLHKSEQRYRSLTDDILDSSKVGIFILDDSFKVVWLNQALERYFGLRRKDVIGKDKRQLILKQIKDIFEEPETFVEKVFATYDNNTYIENFECHVLADGQRENRWLEHWSQPIRSGLFAGGRIEHYTDITKRKKVEEALRKSKNKYRTLLENLPQKIFLKDRNSVYVSCNENYARDLNIKAEEIVGRTDYEFYSKELAEKYRKDDKRIMKSGETEDIEEQYIKDGKELIVHTVKTPVKDARGNVIGILGIFWDITERKWAEEEIKKFKTISDKAGFGVGISDLESNLTYVNELFAQMHGYKVDELIGKNLSIFHSEEQMENVNRLNKQLIEKGSFVAEEVWHSRKDGTIFCALVNGTLIRDDKGQPQFLSCTALDITERKQVEEKVLESEKKYRGLTENLSELVYRAEPKTFVATYVNNAVERFYGYSAEEWLRDPSLWENMIHPDDKERVLKEFEETKRKLKSGVIKYRIINKNETVRWVEDHVSWEKDQQGKVISMNGVMYDITEHQKTEERQTLRFEISKTFHQQKSLKNICKKIVSLIKEYLDYEVVALRMKEGDDYPYFVNNGFSQKFIKSENYLYIHDEKGDCLRDSRGHPVLACMCGIVINAKFNQDKPFFTKEGSFWTNSTSDLLASTTAEDRGETTRNVCNQYGYESIALIPIKVKDDNIGLLQINDKRRNLFSLGSIQFLEELGRIIGIATEHIKAEEALRESEESLAIAQRVACIGSWDWNIQDNTLTWSDETYRQFGFKPNEITPTYEAFVDFVHRVDRERVNQAVKQAIDVDNCKFRCCHIRCKTWGFGSDLSRGSVIAGRTRPTRATALSARGAPWREFSARSIFRLRAVFRARPQ
ncbi:MAG: PAS domain S-box protein [Planctomycetes bacterium]|nr:PAS domain S-box protein [Planctomycetota bacterium]